MKLTEKPTKRAARSAEGLETTENPDAAQDPRVAMVLDTDTYNEIDDQFALVYAAIAQCLDLKAVYAAPFANKRSSGPADGMEKSYEEILRVLKFLEYPSDGLVYRGSTAFMTSAKEPVDSEAARHLIDLAHAVQPPDRLYVVAIGAITNVASALLLDPSIKERIAVVWLGGHPPYWEHNWEFNLQQDPYAAQVVFDSEVPVVHVPCKNVAEHVKTSVPELKEMLRGTGRIGEYLLQIFTEYVGQDVPRTKEIWDLAAVAWLVDPESLPSKCMPTPVLNVDDQLSWTHDESRHLYRVLMDAKRDKIFQKFVSNLRSHVQKSADTAIE